MSEVPYIGGPYDGEMVRVKSPPSRELRIPYPWPPRISLNPDVPPPRDPFKEGTYKLLRHADDYYQAYVWQGEP